MLLGLRRDCDKMGCGRGRGTCSSALMGDGAKAKLGLSGMQTFPRLERKVLLVVLVKSKLKWPFEDGSNLTGKEGNKAGPALPSLTDDEPAGTACESAVDVAGFRNVSCLATEGGAKSFASVRSLFGFVVANALEKIEPV